MMARRTLLLLLLALLAGVLGAAALGRTGPAWTYDAAVEPPAGTEDRGTYVVRV